MTMMPVKYEVAVHKNSLYHLTGLGAFSQSNLLSK